MRSLLAVVIVVMASLPRVVHADASAEVKQAFSAFVDGVMADKVPATVDVFITPYAGTAYEEGTPSADPIPPIPKDLSDTRGMVTKPAVKVTAVVVSRGGKSAWLAGELPGRAWRSEKWHTEPVRVSAFLYRDDAGWHVQAVHWSTGEKDQKMEGCGDLEAWPIAPKVIADAKPIVKTVLDSLQANWIEDHGVDTSKFNALLSSDKRARAIGSAAKELFVGGAKIKSIFKKWELSADSYDANKLPARAAVGPDGEMAWVVMAVNAPQELCTRYRTLFVLAKEPGGWRIVHHHYSQRHNPY